MHILILPNSFKGSLSARQTARVLTNALQKKHRVHAFALSDGGDGFVDFFKALHPAARIVRLQAQNAFQQKKSTSYLWLEKEKTAVIESARICGLGKAKKEELDPLGASSFGVGQVIAHAVKRGAKKIYIGLGGVACNDGGAGLARALGTRFLDKHRLPLPNGAQPLRRLQYLDNTATERTLRGIKIYAIADVRNPMLGPKGSARVFGPQKGATAAQVRTLEKALRVYARAVRQATGKDIAHTPGTAAAGALGAGLYGLLGAQIVFGADFIKKHLPLDRWARRADLLITTEGKLDEQTLYGKAPLAVLDMAAKLKKPVLFLCGTYAPNVLAKLPHKLHLQLGCLTDFAPTPADSMRHTARYLRRLAHTL